MGAAAGEEVGVPSPTRGTLLPWTLRRGLGPHTSHATATATPDTVRGTGTAPLVLAADLAGTFLFAIEGALQAMRAGLDLLGVAVIAFVAALGGGIMRDILLGDAPPAALRDRRYPLLTLLAALMAVLVPVLIRAVPATPIMVLDAAGLALFAVAGTEKAVAFGSNGVTAAMLGMLTAVGGGATRDVLLARIPVVLRTDFYATAALGGAVAVLLLLRIGAGARWAMSGGFLTCFGLRVAGALLHWHLPTFQFG